MAQNSNTKDIIFFEAIKLISSLGFEAVNLRQLAQKCNIKAASIYNHFSSKKEILNEIYKYYETHFLDNYKTNDDILNIIQTKGVNEIIDALTFTFESIDPNKHIKMILITKIIYSRFYTDEKAKDIFYNLMLKDREEDTKKLLDYAISIKRFKPFDTKTFSFLLCASMHLMGMKEFCKTDYTARQLEEEKNTKEMFSNILSMYLIK